jgi:hypothetical protein
VALCPTAGIWDLIKNAVVPAPAKPEVKPEVNSGVKPEGKQEPEKKNWLQRLFN